jgi:nucleoside-diphosphate-sugar epimerase
MRKVIIVTGASSGFGAMAARELAKAGHTVYASMRETQGRNAPQVVEVQKFARENSVDLRTVELDVASDASVVAGIETVLSEHNRLDVVVHNAGHMVFGPAEAFTPEQFANLYDINVLSTQRVNRAALPYMREQGKGLLVWVSSTSTRGGTPPFLAPIIVPGAFTKGTNHFLHAGAPQDQERLAEYDNGPYAGVAEQALKELAGLEPPDADVGQVASAIVRVVDTPFGKRPFRVHIDPSQDGAEVVAAVADRVRREMFRTIGLADLLSPRVVG